jgi:hypothetical protein
MAREPERSADREDDDRIPVARQREHGQGRQGEDEAAEAQQHAAEEPGKKETEGHGAYSEEGHAATASPVSVTSTGG